MFLLENEHIVVTALVIVSVSVQLLNVVFDGKPGTKMMLAPGKTPVGSARTVVLATNRILSLISLIQTPVW